MRLASLIVLLATPLWITSLHAVTCRIGWVRELSRQAVAAAVGVFTAVLTAALVTGWDQGGPGEFFFALLVAGLLAHVYFHLFNMSETARRIRLLLELREGFEPALVETYTPRKMISVRLARLREIGQVNWIDGRYFARDSWLLWAAILIRWHERLLFPARFGAANRR